MTDYNELVKKQHGKLKKDAYPNILGKKMPEAKENPAKADEMFSERLEDLIEDAKQEGPKPSKLMQLDEIAHQFSHGLQLARGALAALPDSREKSLTITNIDTGSLWAEKAFTGVRQAIEREEAFERFQEQESKLNGS